MQPSSAAVTSVPPPQASQPPPGAGGGSVGGGGGGVGLNAIDMDLQTVQSMDWLFKKERFYLLVQFWQQRATLAEKEVTTLKEQIANNTTNNCDPKDGSNCANNIMDRQTFENEIAAKDIEIKQLSDEVQRLQSTVSKLKESSIAQISRLEDQLEQKRQQVARLEAKLDLQRDYEDLKRELSILRSELSNNPDAKSIELLLEKTKNFHHHHQSSQQGDKTPTQEVEGCLRPSEAPPQPNSSALPSTPTPDPPTPPPLPAPFQNVETFGSMLGEEIVASWRRNLGQQFAQFNPENHPAFHHHHHQHHNHHQQNNQQQQHQQQQQQQREQQQKILIPPSGPVVDVKPPLTPSDGGERTPASTPQPMRLDQDNSQSQPLPQQQQHHQQQHPRSSPASLKGGSTESLLPNGNPKSPEDNNNHHHVISNNNMTSNMATMCAVNNFLRGGSSEDSLKSPYRFEDHHRSPFRFAEDLGMAPGSMVGRLGESLIPKGDPMEAKLQEMLRYNMDKYASQNLDTLHISRRVRELLSIHNIGQRLFAKYILGLSQGTVSELLSKPKPWDKLTEKGRDSYRKMHAWACDEQAILLLKSLIPKKDNFSPGKESGMPTFGGRPENDLTEERIAHILSEASQFQQLKQVNNQPVVLPPNQQSQQQSQQTPSSQPQIEDSRSNDDSKSPHGQSCLSPFSKDSSSQNRRLKKYENDDIPQEKVVRIYQEELAKLMGRRIEDLRNPREAFPSVFFPQLFTGAQMDRTQEEIRMALDAYHREIVKLNQAGGGGPIQMPLGLLALQQQALQHHLGAAPNGGVQDLSLPKEKKMVNGIIDEKDKDEDALRHSGSAFSLVRPKLEPGGGGGGQSGGSTASSPLGNAILPPAMTPNEDFNTAAVASPLQRMASITNSLISQPPSQPHHSSSQRPLKAVLPPITQQQFDQYNNLNTEDIVKRVKEQLSQYSISQRLFGESVLGLSQGSVSDLLARPKPWHMLTQKGREPFIRMKMFLEDDNAVHKLVASQYKIAPEKLMRTGGYGGAGAPIGKPMPPTPKMLSDAAAGLINKMQQETQSLLPPSLQLGPPPPGSGTQGPPGTPGGPPPPGSMLLTPPGVPPHHAISLHTPDHVLKKSQNPSPHVPHSPMTPHQVSLRNMHQHMSPSVYEMAALTQDLDTQIITTKIKEALLANNIGQKIFGEAVLGLSQGSVSELLSKPKPWHMLSIKGREPFIRMQLWLNDAHNIDRLQALKNERREANKRRRSSGAPGAHDNSSDTSSNDTSEFYHSNSPGPGPPSAKKQRVLFSEEQKEALRLAFALDPYPNVATIEFLASELGLSSRTITNWFHNHRMRLKQQVPHGMVSDIPPRDQTGSQGPFDPVQFRLLLNQRLLELSKERMGLSGVPLPYPPYLAANTNLAALISRGLLPTADMDLNALNINAVKEEMSGLDLSMGGSMKREPGDYDDDDVESNACSEDSMSEGEEGSEPKQQKVDPSPVSSQSGGGGRSRRKPAAPQWVNPDWQEEKPGEKTAAEDEVIINGVCVMQTEDYGRRSSEETVHRVEPTPVMDRFDESDAASSISEEPHEPPEEPEVKDELLPARDEDTDKFKKENEDERWDY